MANRRFIDFPIATTVGDSDIILIWQSGVNKQTTKATFLSGLPENLDELNDVAISGLTNGQILRYDSVTGKWENTDQGNLDLNDLNDVSIVSPSNGQVLVYNSSTSKWENSSGGFVPYVGAVTTVNLGAQTIQAGQFVKAGGTSSQFLKADGSIDSTAYGTGSVTSVGLTMPSAFNVANSPITSAGTLAVTGAGTVAQYIRGDGSLADFPEASGGGSSISYYLNGSVNQGTIGGVAYKELNKVPILGAGTDFTINADGYIASFITDAGDPNLLEIPGGNWNFETYFSASSGGGSPTFYVELYKVSGTTATLIASNSSAPELIAFGTNITAYFSSLAVPTTTLALTDRLAVRYYVTHSGRTITMHTENNHLCQIITTFTTGLTALNGLTAQVQNFATGTTGTDFNIASATATHTFNLPTASATNRGALSSADWTTFNNKQNALGFTPVPSTRTLTINGIGLDLSADRSWSVGDMLLNTYQVVGGVKIFNPSCLIMEGEGTAQPTSLANTQVSIAALTGHNSFGFNSSNNIYFNKGTTANGGIFAFSNSATRTYTLKDASGTLAFTSDIPTNPVGGTGTTNYLPKFTGTSTIGNSQVFDNGTNVGIGTNTPTANLEVYNASQGNIYISSALGNASALRFFSGGNEYVTLRNLANGNFDIETGTGSPATRMRITSGGNLLVGTTTDNGARLQVSGTLTASSTTLTASANTYAGGSLKLTSFTGGTNIFLTSVSGLFALSNGGGADHLLIASTGAATFSSNQNATSTYTIQNTDSTNTSSRLRLDLISGNSALSIVSIHNDHNYIASVTGKDLYFQQSFGGTTNMIIKSSGNVLIGTTTDNGARLNVQTSGSAVGGIRLTSATNTNGSAFVASNAGGDSYFGRNSSTGGAFTGAAYATVVYGGGNYPMGFYTNDTEQMRITSSGNVLIGTTTDNGQKLQVNGTSYFSSDLLIGTTSNSPSSNVGIKTYADGRIYCVSSSSANTSESYSMYSTGAANYRFYVGWGGTIYATSTSISGISDISLKRNIRDLDKGLQDILQLKPRRFDWKNGDGKDNIGFVAQEIESIFPELISEYKYNQFETKKSLKMGDLIPSLVKAIQELKQEIDTLKK